MPGPWESYQTASAPSAGPWSQYQAPPVDVGKQPVSAGGVAEVMTDHARRAIGAAWDTIAGAGHVLTTDPRTTAQDAFHYTSEAIGRFKDAASKGNLKDAALSAIGALPLAGPAAEQIAREIDEGHYAEAIGHAAGLRALSEAPGVIKAGVKAAPAAAEVVSAAAKAGGKDVAVGAAKTAGGAAIALGARELGAGPVVEYLGARDLVTTGVKQVGRGLRSGWEAGKAELQPEPPPAPPRTPIWTGPAGRPAAPAEFTPIPGRLPSGRVPGGPAIDPVTGQILENVSEGELRTPAAGEHPAKTAFNAARAKRNGTEPPPEAPPQSPAPTPPAPAAPAAPAAAALYGKQYITPGQLSRYAADNGLAEEDAAAALEQQGTTVVERGATNRVLHAIGAELGYDHGTLSEISHASYGKGLGKITHEQMMELTEKLGNEQATKEPLASKSRPRPEGSPLGGVVQQLPVSQIHADPVRFQFKAGMGQGGAGEELRAVTKFDPEKSGILSVWKDPADGKTYVVNGHHRLELAQRTGAPEVTVRYIDAANAAEARAKGAMINIAEGRGTSLDAAKVFRDSGLSEADLQNQGISLRGAVAKEGLALSKLDPNLFNQVVSGEISPQRGAMIGQVAEHADQRQLVKLITERERAGKPMPDSQISEMLRLQAPQVTETQTSLFGDNEVSRSLIAEKAAVSDYIQSRLTQKRRLFNAVGTERAATRLAETGNVIDAEGNAAIAEATNQEHAVYQKLSTSTGPISDVLDSAARALHAGDNSATVKVKAYAKIEPLLKAKADALAGRSGSPGERPEGSPQPRGGEAGAGEHNQQTEATQESELTEQLSKSLETARQKRAAASKKRGGPMREHPGKRTFEELKARPPSY